MAASVLLALDNDFESLEEELHRLKGVRAHGEREIQLLERDLIMSKARFGRGRGRGGFGGRGGRLSDRSFIRRGRGGGFRSSARQFYGLAKSGPAHETSSNFGSSYAPPPTVQSTITVPDRERDRDRDRGDSAGRSGGRSRKRRRPDSSEERPVEKPKDPETRRRLLKATKKMAKRDPTIAKRNKRMFGGILTHLKRAARESKVNSEINSKAEALLVTQRESVQQFSESALLERIQQKREEKKDKDEVLNWKLFKVSSTILGKKMQDYYGTMQKFLWTNPGPGGSPPISWAPADGNLEQLPEGKKPGSSKYMEVKLKDTLKEIEESIPPPPIMEIEPKEEDDKKDLPKDFDDDDNEAMDPDDKAKSDDGGGGDPSPTAAASTVATTSSAAVEEGRRKRRERRLSQSPKPPPPRRSSPKRSSKGEKWASTPKRSSTSLRERDRDRPRRSRDRKSSARGEHDDDRSESEQKNSRRSEKKKRKQRRAKDEDDMSGREEDDNDSA